MCLVQQVENQEHESQHKINNILIIQPLWTEHALIWSRFHSLRCTSAVNHLKVPFPHSMSQISYKFKGDASHSSLKFEGSSISVGQIKQYIKQKHNLNQADRRAAQELQVFNAETGHGTADMAHLPRRAPHMLVSFQRSKVMPSFFLVIVRLLSS